MALSSSPNLAVENPVSEAGPSGAVTPEEPAALDQLAATAVEIARARRATPGATSRFQFNKTFTLKDAIALVPYLHDLGITHV